MAATCNAAADRARDHGCMGPDVLIVDDSEQFLASAKVLLEREGMNVVGTASTSGDAIAQVRRRRPDVVLLDLNFGSISGLDVAAALTADESGSPAVILVSTESYDDVRDLIVDAPVRGFVTKVELSASAIESLLASA